MRRRPSLALFPLLPLLLTAWSAGAAELQKGAWELGLSALLQDTQETGTYVNISTRVGYMLTQRHEAGLSFAVLWVKPDSGGTITANTIGGFYRYNFATSDRLLVPFMGALAYSFQGDLRQSLRWGWQIESGVRIMPTPAAGINVALFWKREASGSVYVPTQRALGATVGFSLFL